MAAAQAAAWDAASDEPLLEPTAGWVLRLEASIFCCPPASELPLHEMCSSALHLVAAPLCSKCLVPYQMPGIKRHHTGIVYHQCLTTTSCSATAYLPQHHQCILYPANRSPLPADDAAAEGVDKASDEMLLDASACRCNALHGGM